MAKLLTRGICSYNFLVSDPYIWEGLWERSCRCGKRSNSRSFTQWFGCGSRWYSWSYAGINVVTILDKSLIILSDVLSHIYMKYKWRQLQSMTHCFCSSLLLHNTESHESYILVGWRTICIMLEGVYLFECFSFHLICGCWFSG